MNTNRALKGIGLLIGLYIVVTYASGSGKVITSGGDSGSKIIRTLQGR